MGERLSFVWINGRSEFFSFEDVIVDVFVISLLLLPIELVAELSFVDDVGPFFPDAGVSLGPVASRIGFVFPRNWGICVEFVSECRCCKEGFD